MSVTLKNGDCLGLMGELPNKSIDMILCDPPYGTTGSKWDSVIDIDALWACYNRVISDVGVMCIFGTEPFCTQVRIRNIENYKYDMIWRKSTSTGFAHAKNMPLRNYENIMVFSKGSINHKGRTKNRMAYNPQNLQDCEQKDRSHKMSSILHSDAFCGKYGETYIREKTGYPKMILDFNKKKKDSKYHVNAKPVDLLEYLIKTFTNEGDTVLDSCMGSGSTGVACINTKRNFIGYELDEEYYKTAEKRIQEAEFDTVTGIK